MLKCSDFDQIGVQKLRKIDHNRSEIDETCDLVVHRRPKTLQAAPRGTQEAVQEGPRRPKRPPMEVKPSLKPSQNGAEFAQK